jgi:serine/threonine protein kinase
MTTTDIQIMFQGDSDNDEEIEFFHSAATSADSLQNIYRKLGAWQAAPSADPPRIIYHKSWEEASSADPYQTICRKLNPWQALSHQIEAINEDFEDSIAHDHTKICVISHGLIKKMKASTHNQQKMKLPASDLFHIIEDAHDWEICKPTNNLHASYTILLGFVDMVCKALDVAPIIPTANVISDCVAFSYQVLCDATKNFNPTISKIGEGSFGTVFKAIINHQGRDCEVAIKRLSYDGFHTPAMNEEFKQEIWRVSTVRHKNIVSLLGYCLPEANSPLLMVTPLHSSLFKHLYEGEKPWLNWQARFKIVMGVAEGLAYLHDGAPERLIHCDIKTGNILFDPNTFQAYIADFGTARFMQRSESMVGTSTLTGTRGFMDPHFQRYMMRSVMVDVYSFGVLLFVLVSGEQDVVHLLELAKDEDVVDEEFINQDDFSYNNLEIRRVLAVARQCTKFEPSDRPTMSKVTMMLNGDHPSESLSSFVVHKNIISPFGYNIKQVDFLSQMATPKYLYLSERLSQLNWEQRLNIAIGVAEALAYLHDNAPQCVVHGNINSGCIVFDPNTSQAYITEFEFAKCMQRSESEIQVSTSTGRQGYIDPHFQRYLQLSPKVDVYSFGILLCFLVSNEQNIVHLIDRVKTTNVVDVFLKHDRTYKAHEVHRMLAIARKCIKFEPTKRPPMSRIVTMLRSIHLSSFQLALLKLLPS